MAIPICLCRTNAGKGLGCPAHGGNYRLPDTERVIAAWDRVNEERPITFVVLEPSFNADGSLREVSIVHADLATAPVYDPAARFLNPPGLVPPEWRDA